MQPILKILLFLLTLISCKESLPNLEPYSYFTERSVHLICKKMIRCNEGFIRTLPKLNRDLITLENCKSSALFEIETKLSQQNETMKQLSESCFQKMLDVDCKDFMLISFSQLSCLTLASESSNVFAEKKSLKKK